MPAHLSLQIKKSIWLVWRMSARVGTCRHLQVSAHMSACAGTCRHIGTVSLAAWVSLCSSYPRASQPSGRPRASADQPSSCLRVSPSHHMEPIGVAHLGFFLEHDVITVLFDNVRQFCVLWTSSFQGYSSLPRYLLIKSGWICINFHVILGLYL